MSFNNLVHHTNNPINYTNCEPTLLLMKPKYFLEASGILKDDKIGNEALR